MSRRLINANEFINVINNTDIPYESKEQLISAVNNAPAVYTNEQLRGQFVGPTLIRRIATWVHGNYMAHCSECGYSVANNKVTPFCPQCGAIMEEKLE